MFGAHELNQLLRMTAYRSGNREHWTQQMITVATGNIKSVDWEYARLRKLMLKNLEENSLTVFVSVLQLPVFPVFPVFHVEKNHTGPGISNQGFSKLKT